MPDYVPTPTDPILETLAIPTSPQIVPQTHITESTTNEATLNYPNQKQTTTRTHGFEHHSQPTVETPSESSPTPINAHLAIANPHREHEDQDQPDPIGKTEKPAHWNQVSATAKTNWRKRNNKIGNK